MQIKTLQRQLKQSVQEMKRPFTSGIEALVTMAEELGEVSTEVQLLEQTGTKAEWEREPSRERLAEEMTHLLNMTLVLANLYEIDLDAYYEKQVL